MATLPRQVEYALMALAEMRQAPPGQLFAVSALCERHEVPFDVMSKAMQRMARARILRAVKGVNGGYQIIKDLSNVTLLDLMEAIMGRVGVVACQRNGKACPREGRCTVTDSMDRLDRRFKELYRTTTVQDLIALPALPRRRTRSAPAVRASGSEI